MKRRLMFTAAMTLTCLIGNSTAPAANIRPPAHEDYAKKLWNAVTKTTNYKDWQVADASPELPCGPCVAGATVYLNQTAAADPTMPYKSVVVAEHSDGHALQGVTVWYRMTGEFDPDNQNWYFAHYLPDGTTVQTSADNEPYAKHGFVTALHDGRLWVFRPGSADLAEFQKSGEPAKHVIRPGIGPGGMTIKGEDADTILAYLAQADGFVTEIVDGRIWVFRPGSEALSEFRKSGEPAKSVIRPAAGPGGATVKAADDETLEAYLRATSG